MIYLSERMDPRYRRRKRVVDAAGTVPQPDEGYPVDDRNGRKARRFDACRRDDLRDKRRESRIGMKIINLTPHAITLAGTAIAIPPSGTIARAEEYVVPADPLTVEGVAIPTSWVTYTRLEDLPPPEPGVVYVVSLVVAQAAVACYRSTDDLLTPGEQVRDDKGRVVGCRSLARVGRGVRVFRWRDQREAFVIECLAQGGSSDVSAEREVGHLGRYARNYTTNRLAGKQGPADLATFYCSTRRGRGIHLIGVPFGTVEETAAAYALLARAGACCNDATDAERAIAAAALKPTPDQT